ncbi:hypothetical protein FQN57_005671 [Myotisia sp. PD_48]|nr:hypothetical protein FQN57_005671 [Myotisia sp. PD_48]
MPSKFQMLDNAYRYTNFFPPLIPTLTTNPYFIEPEEDIRVADAASTRNEHLPTSFQHTHDTVPVPGDSMHDPYKLLLPATRPISTWPEGPAGNQQLVEPRADNQPRIDDRKCRWEGCTSRGEFPRTVDLLRHIRTVHLDKKTIKCPHKGCKRLFSRDDHSFTHFKKVHVTHFKKGHKRK